MHELSLCVGILRILEEQAVAQQFGRVRSLRVSVGALAAVEPEALRSCFEIASRGTLAEGAAVTFARVPATGRCERCAGTFDVEEHWADCPACPGWPLAVTGGRDLRVTQLEVD